MKIKDLKKKFEIVVHTQAKRYIEELIVFEEITEIEPLEIIISFNGDDKDYFKKLLDFKS